MKITKTIVMLGAMFAAGPGSGTAAQSGGPSAAPQAMRTVQGRVLAEELAQRLADNYVFADVGRRYAAMLRANATAGAYDRFSTETELSEQLTADLRGVAPDNHLRVRHSPVGVGDAPGPAAGPTAAVRRPRRAAVESAQWLAPGIAYVRINGFPGSPEAVEQLTRFLDDHSEATTLIFDARGHSGGGLAEMDVIFPRLFARETALLNMETRASVDRARGGGDEPPTLRSIPSSSDYIRRQHFVSPAADQRLADARIFVLTSGRTASAGEHFTLALKRTGRGTVIGQTTGGAGNYGGFERVANDYTVFIPVGRTYDPETNRGWEGTGVAPDVSVAPAEALREALVRSGVAAADAMRIAASVEIPSA